MVVECPWCEARNARPGKCNGCGELLVPTEGYAAAFAVLGVLFFLAGAFIVWVFGIFVFSMMADGMIDLWGAPTTLYGLFLLFGLLGVAWPYGAYREYRDEVARQRDAELAAEAQG